MSGTPRSGRTKKKSALSRLALKSEHTPRDSDESEQETAIRSHRFGARDDLSDALHRQRLGVDSRYPIDADVSISRNDGFRESDSDEGIEVNAGVSEASRARQPVVPPRRYGSSHHDDDDDEDDEEDDLYQGEKRYRDQNSDGDDLRLRNRKEPPWKNSSMGRVNHAEAMDVESPRVRPQSRIGHDEERTVHYGHSDMSADDDDVGSHSNHKDHRYGRSNHLSDDEDNHRQFSSSPMKSPNLTKRLSLRTSREELTGLYKDALERAERDSQSDEDSEKDDDLAELRRYSHSPPRPSARSPEHHVYKRQVTSSSIASSITSRTFKQAADNRPEPLGNMSQASLQSTSVLPMISTREARNRSFMVGSITGNGSFLGSEELERYFPDRKMRIFIGTWNMCELKVLPPSLDEFILPETSEYVHDMYVIGTQESCPNRRAWEVKLQETLGPQHVLLHSGAHGVLYLCIFIRRDLIWYTSVCEEAAVTTRPGPSGVKTKGACGVSFSVFGTSFLFLDTHFAPHDGRIKDRINDFHKICSSLQLPKSGDRKPGTEGDATARFDCVFWMGDLNFRIEKEHERVKHKMAGIEAQDIPDFEDLMIHDELFRARNEGLAFVHFQEGRIKFKPTYKYDIGTDVFDTSKKMRIPSYTDRVLFRCRKKNSITCLHYDMAAEVRISDHRPVYGIYEVNLRPGRDNVQLSAGQFNKEVWLAANHQRALTLDTTAKKVQKQSKVCSIQ